MVVEIRCPRCESDDVPMPPLSVAPEGYVFDGSLILLTCGECGALAPMPEFTVVHRGEAA